MLPTFFIIGAMKSGTTSLWAYLDAHPDVFVSRTKEPDFFGKNRNARRGLQWYEALFPSAESYRAVGEASTSYSKAPHVAGVPASMFGYVPNARLIYVVRHPVERIRSQFAYEIDHGHHPSSLNLREAVRQRPDYLDISRYGMQLANYLEYFDRDAVLLVSSDSLRRDRVRTLANVLEFIGADATTVPIGLEGEQKRRDETRQLPRHLVHGRRALRATGLLQRLPRDVKQKARLALYDRIPEHRLELSREDEGWIWDQLEQDLDVFRALGQPRFEVWRRPNGC